MNDRNKMKSILSYDDVAQYGAGSSNEPLVEVTRYDSSIIAKYIKKDMVPITGNMIYVRDSVAQKLARIEKNLKDKGYRLRVAYGYRHPDVQLDYFKKRREIVSKQRPDLKDAALDRYVYNFVARPDVAGHPAGAAIDITLVTLDGDDVDMGTKIADYSDEDKIKTYASGLTDVQVDNRKVLHDAMISEGFAPFYGEWWHFSYGDREWAAFYEEKTLYDTVDFRIKK